MHKSKIEIEIEIKIKQTTTETKLTEGRFCNKKWNTNMDHMKPIQIQFEIETLIPRIQIEFVPADIELGSNFTERICHCFDLLW